MVTTIEEMSRIELESLCLQYGFQFDKIGKYIRIRSKRDTWYVLDMEHEGRSILLEHQNSRYSGDANFHFQSKHKNMRNVFKSIKSHDNIYQIGHRNNKLTRITNTFKLLGLYN